MLCNSAATLKCRSRSQQIHQQIRTILSSSTVPRTKQEIELLVSKRKSRPPLPTDVSRKDVVIKALQDGWPLSATIFERTMESEQLGRRDLEQSGRNENVVVIASATGVPASFYHPYAAYLASQGSPTICFDYRLCGESFPACATSPSIPESGASLSQGDRNEILKLHPQVGFQHWAQRDYAAILLYAWDHLCRSNHDRYPIEQGENTTRRRGLTILGSSLGGHLFPLSIFHSKKMNPELRVDRALFYSSINPYWKFTRDPGSTRRFGLDMLSWMKRDGFQDIMKWSLGHNIPLRAGLDWIEAAQEPNYTGSSGYMKEAFLDYRIDTLGLSFSDDHLAHNSPRRTDGFNRILGWPESVESQEEVRYWEEGEGNRVGEGGTGSEAYLKGQPPDVGKEASEEELKSRRGFLNARIFFDVEQNGWIRGSKMGLKGKEDMRPLRIGHVDALKPSVGREGSKSKEVWEFMRGFLQRGTLPERGSSLLAGRGGRRDFGD